jgi:hypothetical protein
MGRGDAPNPAREMTPRWRRLLSAYLAAAMALTLGHFLWAWSTAFRLLASDTPVRTRWLLFGFEPTDQFGVMLVVALAAVMGSLSVSAVVFSNRAGHRTLEDRWQHWYLHRPLIAAGIGVLLYVTVIAGLIGPIDGSANELALAAAIGGLAGLFTERVLAAMRKALGATPFDRSTSDPQVTSEDPGTAPGGAVGAASAVTAPVPAGAVPSVNGSAPVSEASAVEAPASGAPVSKGHAVGTVSGEALAGVTQRPPSP